MSATKDIQAAIDQALNEYSVEDVVSAVTGNFVGLVVELVKRKGGDEDGEIKIDGGKNRDITIHAEKEAA